MTRPRPPCPDLQRKPTGPFGWLDVRLLHGHSLREAGPQATAVILLLALAADRQGASFYGRERMAHELSMPRADVDEALQRLLDLRLVAFRPWRPGCSDGIWQLLPLPDRPTVARTSTTLSIGSILAQLGFDDRA